MYAKQTIDDAFISGAGEGGRGGRQPDWARARNILSALGLELKPTRLTLLLHQHQHKKEFCHTAGSRSVEQQSVSGPESAATHGD